MRVLFSEALPIDGVAHVWFICWCESRWWWYVEMKEMKIWRKNWRSEAQRTELVLNLGDFIGMAIPNQASLYISDVSALRPFFWSDVGKLVVGGYVWRSLRLRVFRRRSRFDRMAVCGLLPLLLPSVDYLITAFVFSVAKIRELTNYGLIKTKRR